MQDNGVLYSNKKEQKEQPFDIHIIDESQNHYAE